MTGETATGAVTPELLAAEFPEWRTPARAGEAWITMRPGTQEHHGPGSLIRRSLSAASLKDLARKMREQRDLGLLEPSDLAAEWRARQAGIDEVRARHPEREIRRNGLTWQAVDPTGLLLTVESGRLDFLDAMLGGGT